MEEKEIKQPENKMGVLPVNQLLVSMSVPIMISMLVQALYNVVDSVFVAMVSENALNAVSLAYPVQNLMIAVSTGTGVGINALLSKSLGQKRFEKANLTAVNGVFLGVCSYLVFALLCGLWCLLGIKLASLPRIQDVIRRWKDILVPAVLILLGFSIILSV